MLRLRLELNERKHYTKMPTDNSKNKIPNPRKAAANKLINNSLKMTPPSLLDNFLETSKTKNQAVKSVPTNNKMPARCGKIAGLTGEIYLVMESILENDFLLIKRFKFVIFYLYLRF